MAKKENGELRLPPQNLEAEQAVLGAIMLDPKALDRVLPLLPKNAFYKEAHNRIYDAMLELQNVGDPIDSVTLTNHLSSQGMLDKVGGAYYITGLVEALPSAANVEHYTDIVREKYVLREIITTGNALITDAYRGENKPNELLDVAEHKLFELQHRAQSVKSVALESILHATMTQLDRQQSSDRKHRYSGIPSGYNDLDDMTDGFQSSDLIILASRPSMGKTTLALNMARNTALEYGHKVGIFSMEMSSHQVALRLLTAEAKLDSNRIRRGTLSSRDWPKLSKVAGDLSVLPIYIDDTAGLDILDLRSRIRRFKADYDIELVIIDYLQLLSGYGKYDSRQQEISDISRSLKALAKELEICVMALSQLSRAVEMRGGTKRPILSDLRESGALEQDADVILFIYRPYVYLQKSGKKAKGGEVEDYEREDKEELKKKLHTEVIIGKQRNGPIGTVNLRFFSQYTKFESATEVEVPEFLPEDVPLD